LKYWRKASLQLKANKVIPPLPLSFAAMHKPVICIGAALVDELFHATDKILLATTSDANVTKTAGGVSRNIAHQLALLGVPVQLISVFGNDSDGDWLKTVCRIAGVKLDGSMTIEGLTGKYTGILNVDGSLFAAFLTNAANHLITPPYLDKHVDLLKTASYLLADANVNVDTIEWLLNFSKETGIPFILEPVSVPPASKLANIDLNGLYLITPNEDELPVICKEPQTNTKKQIDELLERGVKSIWLHNGIHGSNIISKEKTVALHASLVDVLDCTGAGDGSLSGFLLGKHLGKDDIECLKIAHTLASEILQVNGAIATHLDQKKLLNLVPKYFPEHEGVS
jgi:pseudouridine kinase